LRAFTRQAAQEVVGASLETLANLADKSLLRRGSDGRFDIHQIIKQYAENPLGGVPKSWPSFATGTQCSARPV
jgi:hypothetical protein